MKIKGIGGAGPDASASALDWLQSKGFKVDHPIAFDDEPADAVLEDLADELGARVTRDTSLTAAARAELAAYFAGRLRSFSVPVDRTLIPSSFTRKVLAATARIPYGAVATYGEIAGRAGAPQIGRAHV